VNKKTFFKTTSAIAITSFGIFGPTPSVMAQGSGGLEEIVVTARRREETLLKVPVAISAVTASAIEDRGLKTIQEISEFTPGMFSQVGGNGRVDRASRRLTFRGLSTSSGAVFIDGAAYSGSAAPDVTDVERVEVLKGPQSVYFGRATFSGAVNYVTKAPSDTFKGSVSAEAYSYEGFNGSLGLEGPIVADRVTARLNLKRYSFGGQYRNGGSTNQKLGTQDSKSISASANFTPTDSLKINGYFGFIDDNDGVPVTSTLKVAGVGPKLECALGGTGGPWWCGELPKASAIPASNISVYATMDAFTRRELLDNVRGYPVPFDSHWLEHFGLKRYTYNSHIRLDYDLESGWEIGSIVAYNKTKQANVIDQEYRDSSNVPNPFYPATPALLAAACAAPAGSAANQPCFTQPFHQLSLLQQSINTDYSLEFRLSSPQDSRLRGTLGGSYFRTDNPGGSNFGFQAAGRLTQASTKTGVRTPAVFGGVYYDITDDLTLSGEARYQWDGIRQQQLFPAFTQKLEGTFKSFSPRVTLDYNLTPESMMYGTWSRGYRPGGFNSTLLGLAQSILDQIATLGTNLNFRQEKLDNFELGHKATWFDGTLRTTAALYYMKWRDGQVANTQFFTRPDGSTGSATVTQNIGQVNLKGVELEADIAATDHLTISATFDHSINKIKNYVFTPDGLRIRNSTNVNGNRLDQSPAWAWTISPSYSDDLVGEWKWFARVDYRHRGKVFFDQTNVGWLASRDLFNGRVGIEGESLKVELYVNNIFNDKKLTEAIRGNDTLYGVVTPGCPPCTVVQPTLRGGSVLNELRIGLPVKRTFGISAKYDF